MKKILLIIPYGSVGGMERLAQNFYNHLKNKNHTVKVVKFIRLKSDIINFGDDEINLSLKDMSEMSRLERGLFYIKIPFQLKSIIAKFNIDKSIAFGDMANFYSSISFTRENKIGSVHALKSVELINKTIFNRIIRLGYRHTYNRLNKLVCISSAIQKDLIDNCGYRFHNTRIIFNPHDVDKIRLFANEQITEKFELDIFNSGVILFLGRISIQKAPWHIIHAFSLIQSKSITNNLVFIGDGDREVENYLLRLVEYLDITNKVFFFGRRSNPYKYLKRADLLVLSSNYEGTPNVIVESIAVGTPIVSTLCTNGIIELMSTKIHESSDNNKRVESGIITPNIFKGKLEIPTNFEIESGVENLSEAIYTVLQNKENFDKSIKRNASELLSKFNLDEVVKQYFEN